MLKDSLPGTRFGELVAVRLLESIKVKPGYIRYLWEFKCSCGAIVIKDVQSVKHAKWPNCGCVKISWSKMGRTPLPIGEASFNHLYSTYKRGAQERELIFTVTKEDFKELTSRPCYYCGLPPSRTHLGNRALNGHYTYSGLDRVDNDQGYSLENLVSCCKVCNYAKRNVSQEEFLFWLTRIQQTIVGAQGER